MTWPDLVDACCIVLFVIFVRWVIQDHRPRR